MPQRLCDLNTKDVYNSSLKKLKNIAKHDEYILYHALKDLGYTKYREFIKATNEVVAQAVIENVWGIKLTEGSGVLGVRKKKADGHLKYRSMESNTEAPKGKGYQYTKLSIDWKKTKANGVVQYHWFDNTSGFRFKFFWNKKHIYHFYLNVYFIKMERKWKQYLVNKILEGKADYPAYKR